MRATLKTLAAAAGLLLASTVAALAAPAIATVNVNVHSGPSINAPVIGLLRAGTTVNATECGGEWCRVGGGFVVGRYLRFGGYGPGYSAYPAYPAYEDYYYDYGYPYGYPFGFPYGGGIYFGYHGHYHHHGGYPGPRGPAIAGPPGPAGAPPPPGAGPGHGHGHHH
jgi:Bacterial SH3 domain